MKMSQAFAVRSAVLALVWAAALCETPAEAGSLKENNEVLFGDIQRVHGLSDEQMRSIRGVFSQSGLAGQGNPAVTRHPVTPEG